MRSNYDAAIKLRSFQEESYVLLYVPKKKRGVYAKWNICWIGPCKVIRKINQHNYVLKKSPKSKEIVVHADRLKHYFAELIGTPWAKGADQSADVQGQSVVDENVHSATTASQQPLQSDVNTPRTQPVVVANAGRPLCQHKRPARYLQVVEARLCSSCSCVSARCRHCSYCRLDNYSCSLDYSTHYSASICSVSSVNRNCDSAMSDRSLEDHGIAARRPISHVPSVTGVQMAIIILTADRRLCTATAVPLVPCRYPLMVHMVLVPCRYPRLHVLQ